MTKRIEQLLERLGTDLTEVDFARLVIACADQAGVTVRAQQKISGILIEDLGIDNLGDEPEEMLRFQ